MPASPTVVTAVVPVAPSPDDLRAFRARHDLSGADLAAALGLHHHTIERYEAGANPIPAHLRLALTHLDAELRRAPVRRLSPTGIATARRRLGLSTAQFGAALGVTEWTVRR